MAEIKYLEAWGLEFHEYEEAIVDKKYEVFDTIILHDTIEAT